ncbi:MAG: GGDEF domain-containing protein, partial [Lachnospiraceae bacterium]|nr:GGDEF domain-containing protein [Lachnospiraceae bacterium]
GMLTLFSFMISGFIMSGLIKNTLFVEVMECNIFCLGPSFFGYFLLLDFLMNISDVYSKRQEYDSLEWLAYSDGLTGIANRAKYTQYLSELEKKKTDYCIISMDLDGLKKVNDTYGHESGDRLLIHFSEILKDVFADDFVARIGGDEFAAILENDEEFQVEAILREMREKLDRLNETGRDPWSYSVSAGYAYRHESEEEHMHRTYLLADQRMYEEKKMRKEMNEMKVGAYQNV